jgi:hypothetical protein
LRSFVNLGYWRGDQRLAGFLKRFRGVLQACPAEPLFKEELLMGKKIVGHLICNKYADQDVYIHPFRVPDSPSRIWCFVEFYQKKREEVREESAAYKSIECPHYVNQ